MRCRTTTEANFDYPIYFHPALLQTRVECLPELDDGDVDVVGIPIADNYKLQWDRELGEYIATYSLQVTLLKPVVDIELGGVYNATVSAATTFATDDDVNVGDTIFAENNGSIDTTTVDSVDDGVVTLAEGILADDSTVGWVVQQDTDEETHKEALRILGEYHRQQHLLPPVLAGVCGPLQPIHTDRTLLQYVVLMTGNAKLIVDDRFYSLREWLSGDAIEMRLTQTEGDDDDLYTVIYRHPDDNDGDDNVVWRCPLGTFLIEADEPKLYAAYVVLAGPTHGTVH